MVLSVSTTRGHTWGLPIDASGHPAGGLRQITAGSEGEDAVALSSDGRKLVFVSQRANGQRLLYEDLTTGHQKELSTDEGGLWHGVFNKDGSGVMAAHNEAIHYLPLSGGPPKKIWEMPKRFVRLWDWSPDGETLLLYTNNSRSGVVQQLNLGSLSLTPFLDEPDLDTWQANFSHDGRWVVFNATNQALSASRIYIAPFRKGAVPRSEWIPITDGDWDDEPRFSSDDRMIFFVKGKHNQPHSLWSQRLNNFVRPDAKPVAVYSVPDSRRGLTINGIAVGPRLIVFNQAEPTGNIWLAEPVKGATKQ
jgi:Tol biopolymer transport system component